MARHTNTTHRNGQVITMGWNNNHKHVPTVIRNACLIRDGNQCTATLRDGTRCPETTRLEAHHIRQYRPGEKTDLDNLITLCAWHHNKITQKQAAAARRRNAPPRHRRKERHPGLL